MIKPLSWEYETAEMLIPIPARCPSPVEQPRAAVAQSRSDDMDWLDPADGGDPVEGVCRRVINRYEFAPAQAARLVYLCGSWSRALQLLVWVLRAHYFLKLSFVPDSVAKADGMVDDATLQQAHNRATAALAWLLAHVSNEPRFTVEAILRRFRRDLAGITDFPEPTDRRDLEALVAAARLIAGVLQKADTFWYRQTCDLAQSEVIAG